MAITVRDIQEKEFNTLAKGGYDIEEVDDFLDEIAEQLPALVRKNVEMKNQLTAMDKELEAAKQAAADAEARTPEFNEKSYFENLQKTIREATMGAQRIADETRAEAESDAAQMRAQAQDEAEKLTSEAQATAEKLTSEAQATAEKLTSEAREAAEKLTSEAQEKVERLQEQFETLKASAKAFKADFSGLLQAQTTLLRDKTDLF